MRYAVSHAIPVLAAIGLALAPLAASPAAAQGSMEQQQGPAQQVDEQQLQSFAGAAVEIGKINREYTQKLQHAQSVQEQNVLRREATKKMTDAIEDKGLTVQEYNAIHDASRQDPEMEQKIRNLIEQKR